MISRGKSRFVDEVYIPNAELRSSAELLSELQKAGGREPCLAQSKTSIQETCAANVSGHTSIMEPYADTLSISPSQASFFQRRTIPTTERKWKVIPANSSYGTALPTAVSKMVTRMVRHYDQDKREPDAALHWDTTRPVLLKAFFQNREHEISQTNIGFDLFIKEAARRGASTVRIPKIPWLQGQSCGITIDPELWGTF